MSTSITVIGAGNAGYAVAGDLCLAGHKVLLFEFPPFKDNLIPIMYSGGILTTGVARNGFARIAQISTDIKEAMAYSNIIMVVTQSLAHEMLAEMMHPHVKDEHIILFMPGSLGTLITNNIFKQNSVNKSCAFAETYTLPYACRKLDGPGTINIHRKVEPAGVLTGVFPSKKTGEVLEQLKLYFPTLTPTTNVVECALQNPNNLVHPIGALLNLGRIEYTKGDFWVYKEGFTDSVFALMKIVDEEKCRVLKKMNLPDLKYHEVKEKLNSISFQDFAKVSSKGPFGLFDRYITEDVPNGLNLISSFGREFGVDTSVTDAIIRIFSSLTGTDYFETGRNIHKLGVSGLDQEKLKAFLYEGK